MIQNVARGPLGDSLRQLEGGLIKLEGIHPEEITGSEARTVLAILLQMDHRVTQLHSQIRQLWNAPADRGHPFDTFGRAGSSAPSAALGE